MGNVTVHRAGYRSLFWPIILIAIGVIWLLGNMGVISSANLIVVFRLWPLILIVVGLDLLFGRQSPAIGALIGIGTVVVLIALMLVGPSIGLGAPDLEVQISNFRAPLDDATSARIELDPSVGKTTVQALTDSSDLFTAEVSHVGTVDFAGEGETEKIIRLRQETTGTDFLNGLGFLSALFDPQQELYWNVGLSPDVPIGLTIRAGAGESNIDLRQVELSALDVNVGVGKIDLRLPAAESSYNAALNGGVGEVAITIADNAALDLTIDGGVGSFTIDVPDGAAVKLNAKTGVGEVHVPGDLRPTGDNTWETSGFSEAARRITITFDGGVGSLTVQ